MFWLDLFATMRYTIIKASGNQEAKNPNKRRVTDMARNKKAAKANPFATSDIGNSSIIEEEVNEMNDELNTEATEATEVAVDTEPKVKAKKARPAKTFLPEGVATVLPSGVTVIKRGNRLFVVDPETQAETPRKAWVIEQFEGGRCRADIAKDVEASGPTIFSYTKGLSNEFHTPGSGRGSGRSQAPVRNPLTDEVSPRNEVIQDLYAAGWSRREIASEVGVKYMVVYTVTKYLPNPEATA